MSIQEAHTVDINELLRQLGCEPTKRTDKDTWYRSPFRIEHTASFHVDRTGRMWFDFGEGVGGGIIELALRLAQTVSVVQALQFIEQTMGTPAVTLVAPLQPVMALPVVNQLVNQQPFDARSSAGAYLAQQRGIDPQLAAPYLRQLIYQQAARQHFAFGMANLVGGYEARRGGDWQKTTIGPKAPSVFRATTPHAPWYVFEGLMDCLTFLTVRKPPVGQVHLLVLNGTGLVHQAINYLRHQATACLYLCGQRDAAGQAAAGHLLTFCQSSGWESQELTYPLEFADYNAWWQAQQLMANVNAQPAPTLKRTPCL